MQNKAADTAADSKEQPLIWACFLRIDEHLFNLAWEVSSFVTSANFV